MTTQSYLYVPHSAAYLHFMIHYEQNTHLGAYFPGQPG